MTNTAKIALELGDRVEENNMHVRESRQLLPLNNYYQSLGKFDKTIQLEQKRLNIALQMTVQVQTDSVV